MLMGGLLVIVTGGEGSRDKGQKEEQSEYLFHVGIPPKKLLVNKTLHHAPKGHITPQAYHAPKRHITPPQADKFIGYPFSYAERCPSGVI
jgi:hypothetical protein